MKNTSFILFVVNDLVTHTICFKIQKHYKVSDILRDNQKLAYCMQ